MFPCYILSLRIPLAQQSNELVNITRHYYLNRTLTIALIAPPRSSPQPCLPPSPLPVQPAYPTTDATLSPDQYRTVQYFVDVELPVTGCSAAKVSKLDYYADGTLIVTFPTQVYEILTGIIEQSDVGTRILLDGMEIELC